MFVQDNLRELKINVVDKFPRAKFLFMFSGVVVGPLLLTPLAGRDLHVLGQTDLAWSLLGITLLLLISMGGGLMRFRNAIRVAEGLAIAAGRSQYR